MCIVRTYSVHFRGSNTLLYIEHTLPKFKINYVPILARLSTNSISCTDVTLITNFFIIGFSHNS